MTDPSPPDSATLRSENPATGEVVGTYPVDDTAAVDAAVARARASSAWWVGLGFDGRRAVLRRWRGVLARGLDDLAAVVHAETGKPHADARLEIGLAVEHLAWVGSHAERVLRRRRRSPGVLQAQVSATVEHLPLGVVGVIGPWNYPVYTPMGSVAYALGAGNTVVLKPSELTPGVGRWLGESLRAVAEGHDLLEVVVGEGATGAALCRAAIDKLVFTGSTATARTVMATCAERLTPVLVEAGGKDALLVDADADVEAAADAAAWGAFSNAGQTCIGIERVYVHTDVADAFLDALALRARAVRTGPDDADAVDGGAAQIGPMTMPTGADVVRRHVDDALARGGRALVGGPVGAGDRFLRPTVLVDVPEDADAVTEETFGPTVTVARVASMDEAVERANAGAYGLGSAVFSAARGPELARRLRCGMTSVNSVIAFAGVPSLPFGGVGDSGFGRVHGPEGLRELTYAKAVARQRFRPPVNLTSFGRTAGQDAAFARLVRGVHGRRRRDADPS